jgi:hypothetical protein
MNTEPNSEDTSKEILIKEIFIKEIPILKKEKHLER